MRLGDDKIVFVQFGDQGEGGVVRFQRVAVDVDEGKSSPWLVVRRGLQQGLKLVVSGAILLSHKL